MGKAHRIKMLKKQKRQKSELIKEGISFFNNIEDEADFFIVTVPGIGSVNVTSNVKNLRRAS